MVASVLIGDRVIMRLLGSTERSPESCYVVTRVFYVVARELCGCYGLQGGCQRVAMQLLGFFAHISCDVVTVHTLYLYKSIS